MARDIPLCTYYVYIYIYIIDVERYLFIFLYCTHRFFYFQGLNRIDLGHVPRGASLNATSRSLVRAAYDENASIHDSAPREFDLLLGKTNKKLNTILILNI